MVNFCKDCPTTLREHYIGSKMPLIQFSAELRQMLKKHKIQSTLLNPGDKSYKKMHKILPKIQHGDLEIKYEMKTGKPEILMENLTENVDEILKSDFVSDVYAPTFSEIRAYNDYLKMAPKYVNIPLLRKLMIKFI